MHLSNDLPSQGLLPVGEETAPRVTDELELGVIIRVKEAGGPVALRGLPQHQHVVVGGIGVKEAASQDGTGVVIHE